MAPLQHGWMDRVVILTAILCLNFCSTQSQAEESESLPKSALAIKENAERFRSGTFQLKGFTTVYEAVDTGKFHIGNFRNYRAEKIVRKQATWEDEYTMTLDLGLGCQRLSHLRYALHEDRSRVDEEPQEFLFLQNPEISVVHRRDRGQKLRYLNIYDSAPLQNLERDKFISRLLSTGFRFLQPIDLRLVGWAGRDFLTLTYEEAFSSYFYRPGREIKEYAEGDLLRLEVWTQVRDLDSIRTLWWCDPKQGGQPIRMVTQNILLTSTGEILEERSLVEELTVTWSQVDEIWLPKSIKRMFRGGFRVETELTGSWSGISEPIDSATFSAEKWKSPKDYNYINDYRSKK